MDGPVVIELGFDRLEAQLVEARCRAEGLQVELMLMDVEGTAPGFVALVRHRLLVHGPDVDRVRALLPEWLD